MSEAGPAARRMGSPPRLVTVAALLGVLGLAMSFLAVDDAAKERAMQERGRVAAHELGLMAGLESRTGESTARPLPVAVIQEGGPLWAHAPLERAFAEHPSFTVATSEHLVRVEVVADARTIVIAPSLFRQGWGLRLEAPLRIRLLPWLPVLAGCLGLAIGFWRRRLDWGLAVAGLLAQLGGAWFPWPHPIEPVPVLRAMADGPLGAWVLSRALQLSDTGVAIAAGVVAMCMVLAWFDHRRSRSRGALVLLSGLAAALGGVLWVEAAARCGLLAWGTSAGGIIALLGLVSAWGVAAVARRRGAAIA